MASLTFPLALATFFDLLPMQDAPALVCAPRRQLTGLEGGEILSAERAPPLWEGEVKLAPMRAGAAAGIAALLSLLENNHGSFLARPTHPLGPDADPLGAILGAAAPVIATLDADNRRLSISGLPAGYELRPGDLLSFTYATPARYALHRLVQGGTANGLGTTPLLEVTPHIRPGAVAGAAVALVKPAVRAVLVPGSVSYGTTLFPGVTAGMGFAWRQALR